MGVMKRLYTDIQIALEKEDALTLASILHINVGEDGDRSWIVDGMLYTVGQWLYNDPENGWADMLWTSVDLEHRRGGLEDAFLIGGEWYGADDRFICHECAHFLSHVLNVPMDAEEPECDCGRHQPAFYIEHCPPETLPMAVNVLRCPCGSLLSVRMFENNINEAVESKQLSDQGALWIRELNQSLGFSGYLPGGKSEPVAEESEVAE